jgi:hypothetical protein
MSVAIAKLEWNLLKMPISFINFVKFPQQQQREPAPTSAPSTGCLL